MALTIEKVKHAAEVLQTTARQTDLILADKLNCSAQIFLKTENLQATGSFKLRGAAYKISQLTDAQKEAGIIACSAGNHAQGVALAAQKAGIPCTICMPDGAPISKVEATKALGANVILVPGTYDDAYEHARQIQKDATFIHPFDDEEVIIGQGTIALEILDQIEALDAIVVPIGGGGLIAGVAAVVKQLNPAIKVYGVQAENAPAAAQSILTGQHARTEKVETFADGIAVKTPGELTLSYIRKYVDQIVTVTEDEIATAILTLMEKQKLVAEGAGAVAVAALLFNKLPVGGKKVVALVSGGNIDVNILSRVITRGLITSGRQTTLEISLEDKPGQLVGVSKAIQSQGANVIRVEYANSVANTSVTSCILNVGIETRGFDQIEDVKNALKKEGFHLLEGRE